MIQWYPGHIAQFENRLTGLLKLVDVVIEVLDARIPQSSTNPRLTPKIRHKPTLLVLNKSDLADPHQNKAWQHFLRAQLQQDQLQEIAMDSSDNNLDIHDRSSIDSDLEEDDDSKEDDDLNRDSNNDLKIASKNEFKKPLLKQPVMLYDAKGSHNQAKLIQHVLALGEPTMQKLIARGRKRRPIRILVVGMPNVGKSTLINNIVGRKKAKTGHRAGVTRDTQWIRIHPQVELMDSPGIIPPQLDNPETGLLLATVSSIGDAAFEEEDVARFLIDRLNEYYPQAFERYNHGRTLEDIGLARHDKRHGQEIDLLRTAQALLSDFRHARLGRITLEHAPNQSLPKASTV